MCRAAFACRWIQREPDIVTYIIHSVNGSVKLSVMFRYVIRNTTHLWGGGRKMDVVPFYRNWREIETTWQLIPKRTAAASRGFLAAARLSCFRFITLYIMWPVGVSKTKKPNCRWQTRATRKHAKNCSNSTSLQRCRWQYWSIFICLAGVASEICEIPRNSLKIQTYRVQCHPRSSIFMPIEISPYVISY